MGMLGKSFSSKLKTITTLAVSRIAIMKNHRKARASYAHSDVTQLLKLGFHDRALLRVEQWITEQNMLDVFVMIENYCSFLGEISQVLEKNKKCPFELKEATCSLIFASSRCGKFPELHKIQEILTSKFGKEFADYAVGLHKNNNVNSEMIQKLSSRHPTMEIKMEALKKIAKEIGVTLHIEQDPMLKHMEKLNVEQRQEEVETRKCISVDDARPKENNNKQQNDPPENIIQDEDLLDGNEERMRNKYAAEAALEALELASFVISKYLNHRKVYMFPMKNSSSKQKDEVIPKSNHSITDLKELEGKEIQKQEESHLRQNPRDDVTTPTKSMDNNDHQSQSNEHLREERAQDTSSQAIRWNPQRSQIDPAVNSIVRRPVMMTHHEHVDWKMMSVRTR